MALFNVDFPDDFLSELFGANFEEIAEAALNEAAPILEKSMKKECASVIEHEDVSEVVESIKAGKAKRTKTDAFIVNVAPKGYSKTKTYKHQKSGRSYPVSNALKMIWKEYGIPGRQAPRPFLDVACDNVRNEVIEKMQEVFDGKVDTK